MNQRQLGIAQPQPPPLPAAPPDEKLDYIIQQLQKLVAPQLASITIEPRAVLDFVQAVAPLGKTQWILGAFAIACPAGATTQFPYRITPGWVSIFRAPLVFTSDLYDPLLTMQAWVDEARTQVNWPTPLTGPMSLDLAFRVKHFGMDFEFVNGTATDAVVTLESCGYWLEKSFYEQFYQPLVNKMYQAAEGLVSGSL